MKRSMNTMKALVTTGVLALALISGAASATPTLARPMVDPVELFTTPDAVSPSEDLASLSTLSDHPSSIGDSYGRYYGYYYGTSGSRHCFYLYRDLARSQGSLRNYSTDSGHSLMWTSSGSRASRLVARL